MNSVNCLSLKTVIIKYGLELCEIQLQLIKWNKSVYFYTLALKHHMNHEQSIAASYYLLYKTWDYPSTRVVRCNEQEYCSDLEIKTAVDFLKITEDESIPVWELDEWDDKDYIRAQCLLEAHIEKCDIVLASSSRKQGETIIEKFEEQAQQNWDQFYLYHESNFFKDRHYLINEFPEELGCLCLRCLEGNLSYEINNAHDDDEHIIQEEFIICEIGCGVGNAILPLLELDPHIYELNQSQIIRKRKVIICAFDFSSVAIEIIKKDIRFIHAHQQNRTQAQVWDVTCPVIHPPIQNAQISLLLFCLSAIAPDKMMQAARNVAATLQPGGKLLVRDYGRYDEAQIKLGTSRKKRLGENFYVKHDGTRCYYFTLEDMERLFVDHAGLEKVDLKYLRRKYRNRRDDSVRRRVWVQATFRKPTRK